MMKKIISIVFALTLVLGLGLGLSIPNNEATVKAESNEYIVADFEQFKTALSKASAVNEVEITLANDIVIESDLTVKGKAIIKSDGLKKLTLEKDGGKTGFTLNKNSSLSFDNIEIFRSVADETEKFAFATWQNTVNLSFTNCIFDVATAEIPSITYDRIVYCSSANDLNCYLNACEFLTDGYFYRANCIVYNCDKLPQTAGNATVYDFSALKISYEDGKLTFPSNITVSEDEGFTKTVKSGSNFNSQFTYYALKDGYSFSFTTRNLKYETPTIASISVDYSAEIITFSEDYSVYSDSELKQPISSGDSIEPSQKLYVVRKASGIFLQSEVCEIVLPTRPPKRELQADFTCSFGFAMEHVNNAEYRVNGGTWQKEPVFIGLESNTAYTVEVRIAATETSFVSETYTVHVKTTE